MALDRRRMKERLAGVLVEERVRRGGGDARRFPQPKMAALLGYSLRQYQRLEDPADDSIPQFADLARILETLDRPSRDVFGDEGYDATLDGGAEEVSVAGRLTRVERELAEARGLLARIAAALEVEPAADAPRRRRAV